MVFLYLVGKVGGKASVKGEGTGTGRHPEGSKGLEPPWAVNYT